MKEKVINTLFKALGSHINIINIYEKTKEFRKAKSKNKAKTDGNRSKLINYNTVGYLDDLAHICKLGKISESRRDWIETNMLRLRSCANMYEIEFASYLMKKGIKFIHQAPFVLSGKIILPTFIYHISI